MMYEAIKNFSKQFEWEPRVENTDKFKTFKRFIVAGMGGSHLSADLLKIWKPELDLIIHSDYGLPPMAEGELGESMVIASSYSGNTEEVIDAYKTAREKSLALAAVSVGGKLLEMAQEDGVPYVRMPDTGIQPRSALGFSTRALLKLIGDEEGLQETASLAKTLDPLAYEKMGQDLAEKLRGRAPIIYTSSRNAAMGYNWKIKFNETAKIPAFANVFPELNHNEMTGFDLIPETRPLSEKFFFIFLKDRSDPPKIQKRMEVTDVLLSNRGLPVEVVEMRGNNIFHKMFCSLLLADWAAYYTAEFYGSDPQKVPMVEEFKRLIAGK